MIVADQQVLNDSEFVLIQTTAGDKQLVRVSDLTPDAWALINSSSQQQNVDSNSTFGQINNQFASSTTSMFVETTDSNSTFEQMASNSSIDSSLRIQANVNNRNDESVPQQTATHTSEMALLYDVLKKMSDKIVSIESGMKLLLNGRSFTDNANVNTAKCEHCYHCNPTMMEEVRSSAPIQKIQTQADLIALEAQLQQDAQFKEKFITYCHSIIGTQRPENEFGACCLELSRELFEKSFWASTTWLGTLQNGGTKFAFSEHVVFLDIFRCVICQTTKAIPAKNAFATFFQGM